MNDERKPWDQLEGESILWYGRFRAYLLMGFRRSVNAVFEAEHKEKQGKASTKVGPEWYEAARAWKWEERARKHDEHERAEEDKVIAEEKDKVLRSGFALMHKRIQELDRLANKCIAWAEEENKVWIPETRTTTMGKDRSQTVEKVTFNAPMLQFIDKCLDSIAKETGERVKKQELTGKDGGAMEFEIELVGNRPEDEESEG